MGMVVGGGFRVGNSCTPVVDSCQCIAKPIQYCKVKKNFLIKKTKELVLSNCGAKGDQPWVFFERTNAKAETPILWPSHVKS